MGPLDNNATLMFVGHTIPLKGHSSSTLPKEGEALGRSPGGAGTAAPNALLTCLRDERVQGLGLPEALAITGSPVFQPIGLPGLGARGRGRAVVQGGPIPLCCLLGPLSLETHSRGGVACQSVEDDTIWLQIGGAANVQRLNVGTTARRRTSVRTQPGSPPSPCGASDARSNMDEPLSVIRETDNRHLKHVTNGVGGETVYAN